MCFYACSSFGFWVLVCLLLLAVPVGLLLVLVWVGGGFGVATCRCFRFLVRLTVLFALRFGGCASLVWLDTVFGAFTVLFGWLLRSCLGRFCYVVLLVVLGMFVAQVAVSCLGYLIYVVLVWCV